MKNEFWKNNYDKLSEEEWELVCAKCGKCCVTKTQKGKFCFFSNIVCQHLLLPACNCAVYKNRLKTGSCVKVNRALLRDQPELLPNDCAYKILKLTGDLPIWHPLKAGNPNSTLLSQKSINTFNPVYEKDISPNNIKVIDIVSK